MLAVKKGIEREFRFLERRKKINNLHNPVDVNDVAQTD